MLNQIFLDNLKSKKLIVSLIILGTIMLSLIFTFVQTFEYECSSSLYIVQDHQGLLAKDAYAAAKSVTDSKDRMNQLISNRARIIKKCTQTLKPYAGYQWRKFVEEIPTTIETINTIDHDIVQP